MRIGITCYPTYGGSGAIATDLGRLLAEKGHEVHFITSSLPYRLRFVNTPNLFFHEVEEVHYPLFENSPYILLLASKMAEISRICSLDILHVHYAIPHAVSAYLAGQVIGRKRPKIVTTLHGTDVTLIGSLHALKDLTRFSILASDRVTAVSHFLKQETRKTFGIRRDIRVIHNFFDPGVFNARAKKCACIPKKASGEKFLVHISNFRPVKRIPDVIKIFRGVSAALPCRLLLLGDGPEITTARDMAEQYGLADRVHFLGLVDHVAPVLSSCDLLLQVSDHESFGLSSLEALACGIPVIGTSGSGLSEVVTDGKNGLLSQPGDILKMVRDAVSLLRDRETWKKFSRHALRWSHNRFTAGKIVTEYEKCYRQLLNR
jgi:N-acetyl-alpha-D-glucosaminyl L-malate synthase BshA